MIIPRILHQIWLGPASIPEQFKDYHLSWKRHHPDWEFVLWTDANAPESPVDTSSLHAAARADLTRLIVLATYGGVYVDMDVECLKNIEPLISDLEAFGVYQQPGYICNAVLGSTPNHPCIQTLVEHIPSSLIAYPDNILDSLGPGYVTRMLNNDPRFTKLDKKYFYPYLWFEKYLGPEAYPEAYGIHHWSGSWLK